MTANRWLILGGAVSCVVASLELAACASNENADVDADAGPSLVPTDDADIREAGDVDAGPCTDCEFFPQECGPDILCPNGPFDPANPANGMDWRTRVNVIRGRSATDIWIAGSVGAAAHFDGTSWTPSEMGTMEAQRVLWLPRGGVVSLGSVDRIHTRGLDFDAGAVDAGVSAGGWSLRSAQAPPADYGKKLTAAWALPDSDSLWIGTQTDLWRLRLTAESTFESLPGIPPSVCERIPCDRMRSIHSVSASTVWAVGDLGSAIRITDADTDTPSATQLNTFTWLGLTGIWAASDDDVWAVGANGTVLRYTGDDLGWQAVSDVPTTEDLSAVWGTSSSDVWVVGKASVVVHYDGARWSRVKIAGLGDRRPDLYSVWSPAPGHVWIGGQGALFALGGKP